MGLISLSWFRFAGTKLLPFCFHILLFQATIAERGTAFKQHCELSETTKLKEINLYDGFSPFLSSLSTIVVEHYRNSRLLL